MKLEKPAATIKDFFTAHPRVCITRHWRRSELGAAAIEALDAPRSVRCVGRRYVFQHVLGTSEMDARNVATAEVDGDLLHLTFAGNAAPAPHLTYQALCGEG
jgi:hypothetical protein